MHFGVGWQLVVLFFNRSLNLFFPLSNYFCQLVMSLTVIRCAVWQEVKHVRQIQIVQSLPLPFFFPREALPPPLREFPALMPLS
jgi:hypothetical protein